MPQDRLLENTEAPTQFAGLVEMFDKIRAKGHKKGHMKGREEGREEEQRRCLMHLLAKRFGPISAHVQQRVAEFPSDQLATLIDRALIATSLEELGL